MKRKILAVIVGCIFVIGITGGVCSAKTVKLKLPSGAKIRCIYCTSHGEDKRPVVIILPGLSGLRGWGEAHYGFSRWLNKKYNFNVMAVDYRAKTVEGVFSIAKKQGPITFIEEEVAATLDYLRKQESVDKEKIGLVGFSFGTLLAIRVAGREDSVKTVVLVSLVLPPKERWQLPSAPDLEEALPGFVMRPVFFLGDKKDNIDRNNSNAAENTLYWSQQVKGETKVEITNGAVHGPKFLEVRGIKKMIGDWLQNFLK